MSQRTVYDCDRCGRPNIQGAAVRFAVDMPPLPTGEPAIQPVTFDLCDPCKCEVLKIVAGGLGFHVLEKLKGNIESHRKTAPYDMRP